MATTSPAVSESSVASHELIFGRFNAVPAMTPPRAIATPRHAHAPHIPPDVQVKAVVQVF